jgi:hypothetical protein
MISHQVTAEGHVTSGQLQEAHAREGGEVESVRAEEGVPEARAVGGAGDVTQQLVVVLWTLHEAVTEVVGVQTDGQAEA